MDINLNINKAYAPFLNDNTRVQIFYGGSSSGKSKAIIGQRTPLDLLKGGRNYLCLRNTGNTLRGSIYNEIVKGISDMGLSHLFKIHKSKMTITCANGYQAILKGLNDVEKIKSITPEKGVLTDILIEEATETSEDDIKQLRKRLRGISDVPKRITLIFNPVFKTHWIYKEYFEGRFSDNDTFYRDTDLFILKTTYKDNIFLEADDVKDLVNEKDEYFYNVYTLGNWGVLGNMIFKNWKVQDLSGLIGTLYPRRYGLDFGYTNDPTALSGSYIDHKEKKIYFTNELYEYGLTNDMIAEMVRPIIGKTDLACDSAEPKSIEELNQLGINAFGVDKGPGSVNYGIQFLKQYELIIDRSLQNAINEFQMYHWQKNKDGEPVNKPVDKYNHFIDATRYAYNDYILPKNRNTVTFDKLNLIIPR